MSWSRGGHGPGRRGYHHGNLREALIEAALALIAAKGPFGFTVAEAARSAGVSPAAPYRHFRDRDALLAEVARRGFERFALDLDRAWNNGLPEPITAFERVGRAYLAFARAEPAYYAAMFEAGVPPERDPELHAAGERAFGILQQAAAVLAQRLPEGQRPPALMMALHVWAMAHGIASLFTRGEAAGQRLPMSTGDLLEAGVLIYLRGLGITGGDVSGP